MSVNAQAFDGWVRGPFVQLNTALEDLYFTQDDRANVTGIGDDLKEMLRVQGHDHIVGLLAEGNTGDGFASAFNVLGNVGVYLGALRRHELTNPAREDRSPFAEASSLAMHIGASIGMAPRFATSHLTTHNLAVHGLRKSFTALPDEFLFIDENARGILALQRAADALARVVHLGVTSPIALDMFEVAGTALDDVVHANERLGKTLDVDRFFYCVRPYYRPYRVGRTEYRGANAGDFSGINEIDLLLGLTQANDPYYAQLLVDKMPFMPPSEQARLRECMTHRSLLDDFLAVVDGHGGMPWFRDNARAFLSVCDRFADTARQHHDMLVEKFIVGPAAGLEESHLEGVTASGPPLPVLLRSLALLRDYRCAVPAAGSRHDDFARLRAAVQA